jgi:undecaprenyl-diphosphatase
MFATLAASDFRVSGRMQSWKPPRWFRVLMKWATRLGDGWYQLFTLAVLPAVEGPRHLLTAAALALGFANVLLIVLKRRFRRRRPSDYMPQFCGVDCPQLAFDEFSFPSGHALNAFAVSTVLALAFPMLAPLALLVAGAIAVSRVALGHHFVGDVIAGSLLGTALGMTAFWLVIG